MKGENKHPPSPFLCSLSQRVLLYPEKTRREVRLWSRAAIWPFLKQFRPVFTKKEQNNNIFLKH